MFISLKVVLNDLSGAILIEYGLLVTLIAVALIGAVALFGESVFSFYGYLLENIPG